MQFPAAPAALAKLARSFAQAGVQREALWRMIADRSRQNYAADSFLLAAGAFLACNAWTFRRIFWRAFRSRFSRDLSPLRNDMKSPPCDATAFGAIAYYTGPRSFVWNFDRQICAVRSKPKPSASALNDNRFKLPDEAAHLASGQLLIAGGSKEVEVYNPATGKFLLASGVEVTLPTHSQTRRMSGAPGCRVAFVQHQREEIG